MTVEGLQNYFGARLPLELNARQHFRLLRTVFTLVFASAVLIDLLVRTDSGLFGLLFHATTIGLIYVVGVALATVLLFSLRDAAQGLRVWHIWIISIVGFVIGHYFLPFDDLAYRLTGRDVAHHEEPLGFAQLLPVWFLVTYLFVQPYLSKGLKIELDRLRELNALLEHRNTDLNPASQQPILFESGKTSFRLEANRIRNIAVDDHYCYIHYKDGNGFTKRDLAMPLRDVLALLPEGFVQVHRSHVVNVAHLSSIRRKGRNIRLILDNDYEVPVSRHRLHDVLPRLQQQAEPIPVGSASKVKSKA